MNKIIAIDLGGTKCRLGIYGFVTDKIPQLLNKVEISTTSVNSLFELFDKLQESIGQDLANSSIPIVFALPVAVDNRDTFHAPNITWQISFK